MLILKENCMNNKKIRVTRKTDKDPYKSEAKIDSNKKFSQGRGIPVNAIRLLQSSIQEKGCSKTSAELKHVIPT